MKKQKTRNKKQNGQIIILALIFVAVVSLSVAGLVGYAAVQIKSHRQAAGRVQGLSIAEAAVEKAIWKLNNQAGYTGETGTVFAGGVYNVSITSLGSDRLIKADIFIPDAINPKVKRTVQVTARTGTTSVNFNYATQAGNGGFQMDNNSSVVGSIYSSGNITGSSGATVTNNATVSGATGKIDGITVNGNATAHFLEDITVGGSSNSLSLLRGTIGGNAVADTLNTCTIGGNATYDTKASCTISGTKTSPNPAAFTDPPFAPFPIPPEQIDAWEAEAAAGGTTGSYSLSNGATGSLGPKKINGNLTLSNTSTLTLTGTVWVTGEVSLSNGAKVKLSSSYGNLSGVLLAGTEGSPTAGEFDFSNNSTGEGSGTAGSYILMLSQMNSPTNTAISVSNNATSMILYAGTGVIDVSNNAGLKQITAYKVHLNNNASITYETGLADINFGGGGAGGAWEILDGTWQLLN